MKICKHLNIELESEKGIKLIIKEVDGYFHIGINNDTIKSPSGEQYYNWYNVINNEIKIYLEGAKQNEKIKR